MPSVDDADRAAMLAGLIDLRDGIDVVTNLVACLALAVQAPTLPHGERRALGAVINVARDKLEAIGLALGAMIEAQRGATPPG